MGTERGSRAARDEHAYQFRFASRNTPASECREGPIRLRRPFSSLLGSLDVPRGAELAFKREAAKAMIHQGLLAEAIALGSSFKRCPKSVALMAHSKYRLATNELSAQMEKFSIETAWVGTSRHQCAHAKSGRFKDQ